MVDLSAFAVIGNDDPTKQVSVNYQNALLAALQAAINEAPDLADVAGLQDALDDLTDALAAKQPLDADLTTIAANITAAGHALIDDASAAAQRATLGLVIGTDVAARSPVIQSVASAATVTPTFADDQVNITAQAAALALANPTGTAVDGWGIALRIKDNGTARAISYGSQYRALGVTLPTTTVLSKTLYLGMVFNSADTKWDVVAVAQEA